MSSQNIADTASGFLERVNDKLLNVVAADPATANDKERYRALTHVAREQLSRRWVKTQIEDRENQARRIYYLSMEFLVGRALNNALAALGLHEQAEAAFSEPGGPSLAAALECEPDAALP